MGRSGGTGATGDRLPSQARRSNRRRASAALAALIAAPLLIASSPSPQPALNSVLVSPAVPDYVDDNDPAIPLRGEFNIDTYLGWLNAPNATSEGSRLHSLGFVAGFGHVWMQKTSSHLLLEAVIAFSGASGARRWMSRSESLDKTDSTYAHPIAIGGLGSYYAWHGADPSAPEYADYVSFVKGNDFFIVIADSTFEDLGSTASVQSKKQFDSAPAYTVPPAQWPENSGHSILYLFEILLPNLILVGLMLLFVFGVVVIVRWAHRNRPAQIVMSPDGLHWWDGRVWRDASREVPPRALRSPDGYYWWDGRAWRPVSR